jgi:hypothetical protein
MPYASVYVIARRLLALLQVFIAHLRLEWEAWMVVENGGGGVLVGRQVASFKLFVYRCTALVYDVMNGVDRTTTPPVVAAQFLWRFEVLWQNGLINLRTDTQNLLEVLAARTRLLDELRTHYTYLDTARHTLEVRIKRRQDASLACCMALHPRLGGGSMMGMLLPETLRDVVESAHEITLQDLLDILSNSVVEL